MRLPPVRTAVLAAAFVVFAPASAHAYLDPGTIGMIWQLVVGSIVGALVAGRFYWERLKNFLKRIAFASDAVDDGQTKGSEKGNGHG